MSAAKNANHKQRAGFRLGVTPHDLVQAGIFGHTNTPAGAYKRARALIAKGALVKAETLLKPHEHTRDPIYRARIIELLGICALRCGGDWQTLLEAAKRRYHQTQDPRGLARAYHRLGEGYLGQGHFTSAEKVLGRALELQEGLGEVAAAAWVNSTRAQVRARAGDLTAARDLVTNSLARLSLLNGSHEEGLVRLMHARILATLGAREACAKELLIAGRWLASSGSNQDRLLAPLVRAETLIALGQERKAYQGLRRLLLEVVELEDVHIQAWVHFMLGRSASGLDLSEARGHLMRARHLYGRVKATFEMAQCELCLAEVELELGFAVYDRLHRLGFLPLDEWRLFAAELRVGRAVCIAGTNPDLACRLLLEAREFGRETENRALLRVVERTMRHLRLAPAAELNASDDEKSSPGVFGGETMAGAPQPISGAIHGTITVELPGAGSINRPIKGTPLRLTATSHQLISNSRVDHPHPNTNPPVMAAYPSK